jgi:hypothetical protein
MSGVKPFKARNPYLTIDSDGNAEPIGLQVDLAVGTEAADVIEVELNVSDASGNPVAQSWSAYVRLVDGNADATNPATAFEFDATTGTMVTAATQDSGIVTSDAAGDIVLDVTDVAGASGATIYIMVEAIGGVNARPAFSAITFD